MIQNTTTTVMAARYGGEDSRIEYRVRRHINRIRAEHGLPRVGYNARLDRAAEAHTRHMARTAQFGHSGIGDGTAGSRIRRHGFRGSWGEVLGVGQTSAADIVSGWMLSAPHRAVLLNGKYDKVGIAQKVGADGKSYWTANFGDTS